MKDITDFTIQIHPKVSLLIFGQNVNSLPGYDRWHDHNYWQAEFICSGNALMQFDKYCMDLSENSILLIPPGIRHALRYEKQEFSAWSLKFQVNGFAPNLKPIMLPPSRLAVNCRRFLEQILKLRYPDFSLLRTPWSLPDDFPEAVMVEHLLAGLLAYAYNERQESSFQPGDKIHSILKNSLGKPLTVAEAAEKLGYSRGHISVMFRQQFGISLKTFIDRERAEIARQLLNYTDMNISEVADAMGFQDVYYFSNFFKRLNGASPSDFLRKNRFTPWKASN